VQGALREPQRPPRPLAREAPQEELRQRPDVLGALAQWRQVDAHHVQAVEQVLAEAAVLDRLLRIAVGRGDDPHVRAKGLVAADARKLAILQHAQQLALDQDGHLADLVQEQGAAVALLEPADALLHRPRERPLLVPEEFRLQQAFRDGRAVDGHEGLGRTRRELVDRPRHDFLAAARLARDQHRCLRTRHPPDQFEHVLHRRGLADHGLAHGLGLAHRAFRRVLGAQGVVGAQGRFDRRPQFVGQGALAEEIMAAELHRLDQRRGGRVPGNEDHQRVRILQAELLEQVEAGNRLHHQLGDHHRRMVLLRPGHRHRRVRDAVHLGVGRTQMAARPDEEFLLRVHHQDPVGQLRRCGHGPPQQ